MEANFAFLSGFGDEDAPSVIRSIAETRLASNLASPCSSDSYEATAAATLASAALATAVSNF